MEEKIPLYYDGDMFLRKDIDIIIMVTKPIRNFYSGEYELVEYRVVMSKNIEPISTLYKEGSKHLEYMSSLNNPDVYLRLGSHLKLQEDLQGEWK